MTDAKARSETEMVTMSDQEIHEMVDWLERFEQDWSPTRLEQMVESLDQETSWRSAAFIEAVKIDQQRQWQNGSTVLLEEYFEQYPEVASCSNGFVELVTCEFRLRQELGLNASFAEFLERFPDRQEDLTLALGSITADTLPESPVRETETNADDLAIETQRANSPVELETTSSPVIPNVSSNERSEELDTDRIPSATNVSDDDATQSLEPDTMFGRYQVKHMIGRGGMAIVYLAHDTQLDRDIALKIPFFTEEDNDKTIQRFYREARAAATIRHPAVCPIHDVGDESGRHFIAMAWIDGQTLAQTLQTAGSMDPKSAVNIICKVATGLQAAHDCGVVHRDLKPSNIMIDKQGEPILMDFGLARRHGAKDADVTQVGYFLGTPAYMSPEQVTGDNARIGFPSDIYGLGVLLYELLTGQRPFSGKVTQILTDVMTKNPRPPHEITSSVDQRLSDRCMKALHKDPDQRFPSAAEFAAELRRYLDSEAPQEGIGSPPQREIDTVPESTPAATITESQNRSKQGLIAVVLVIAIAVVVAVSQSWNPDDKNASDPDIKVGVARVETKRKIDDRTTTNSDQKSTDSKGINPDRKKTSTPFPESRQIISLRKNEPEIKKFVQSDLRHIEIHCQRANSRSTWDVLDSDNVPLRQDDKIQIHIELARECFAYVYWFDAEGKSARLWPKSLDDQIPIAEIWEPKVADDPTKQKWHVIGGALGMESIVVATSKSPLTASELRDIEKAKLRIAWLSDSGNPVGFEYDEKKRGLVDTVESPKFPDDQANLAYLIVPADSPRRLVLIEPLDRQRAIVDTVESPKLTRGFADFRDTLRKCFQSFSGFVVFHDQHMDVER